MSTDADFIADEEQSRIRAALRMAIQRGPAPLDTIARRAHIAHGYLSSFHRNTRRLRRDSAVRLCEVLGVPPPGAMPTTVHDPLWAAAMRFGADRAVVEARAGNAIVYVMRRDEVVRKFQGRTLSDAIEDMQRSAA